MGPGRRAALLLEDVVRRVPHDDVEAACRHDLGEGDCPVEGVERGLLVRVEHEVLGGVGPDEAVPALDVAVQVRQDPLDVEHLHLLVDGLCALPFQDLEHEGEFRDLDGLPINVHAVEARREDALAFREREPPLAVRVLVHRPLARASARDAIRLGEPLE